MSAPESVAEEGVDAVLTFPTSPRRDRLTTLSGPLDEGLEPTFWRRVADLEEMHRRLWWSINDRAPRLGECFDPHRRAGNERRTRAFIRRGHMPHRRP